MTAPASMSSPVDRRAWKLPMWPPITSMSVPRWTLDTCLCRLADLLVEGRGRRCRRGDLVQVVERAAKAPGAFDQVGLVALLRQVGGRRHAGDAPPITRPFWITG